MRRIFMGNLPVGSSRSLPGDTMAQEHCLGTVLCTFTDPESARETCRTRQRRPRLHGSGLMLRRTMASRNYMLVLTGPTDEQGLTQGSRSRERRSHAAGLVSELAGPRACGCRHESNGGEGVTDLSS